MSNKSIIVTNGDMVRAMTDEELAALKFDIRFGKTKNGYCRIYWQKAIPCDIGLNCKDCFITWLKAPAGQRQQIEEEKKP